MSDSLTPGVHLITANTPNLSTIIDGIVHVHASCILNDATLATFLPPLSHSELYQWWEARVSEVAPGHRHVIVYLSHSSDRTTNAELQPPWKEEGQDWPCISTAEQHPNLEVSGVVSLATPFSQTGPFRGTVQKLLVHPCHRRKGIAKSIMAKLESVAVEHGNWNLMLDTEVGSQAENVYPRLGYERLGVVREYGYSPKDGRLVDEVWFWKDLRTMPRLQ